MERIGAIAAIFSVNLLRLCNAEIVYYSDKIKVWVLNGASLDVKIIIENDGESSAMWRSSRSCRMIIWLSIDCAIIEKFYKLEYEYR
ncbi:MAG: hypothetical protein J7647_24495 [Cyanobacteria bacterium SBLK]|nr:hypothetical protein [Cyanobacteria bacterium SBLK]